MMIMVMVFILLFSFFLSVLASFFNVVIYRTSRDESFSKGRSKCDHCRKQIAWYDNVPLLSFLWLGGRCRNCHKQIAPIYFFTELGAFLLGIVFCLAYLWIPALQMMPVWQLVIYPLILFVLFFVLLADLQYLLVPDFLVLVLTILVILAQIASGESWWRPMIAVVFSTGFFAGLAIVAQKIMKKEAIGMGDLKLMIPLAFLLSWPKIALSIFLAFIIGGVFAMLVLVMGRKKFGQVLPFAPFLIIAALLSLTYGEVIWRWYLSLMF